MKQWTTSQCLKEELKSFKLKAISSMDNKIDIPIKTLKTTRKTNKYIFYNHTILQPFSEVHIFELFPCQLAFVMTVHQAKGRTIDKVVLDLNYHPDITQTMEADLALILFL